MGDKKTERAPREELSAFIKDAILKENAKKEWQNHVEFTEFQPSLATLKEATPDKPCIRSFCSNPESLDFTPEDLEMIKTLCMDRTKLNPNQKYPFPVTTAQEIGWDVDDYNPKSLFDHRHKKSDITMMPTKWNPKTSADTSKDKK